MSDWFQKTIVLPPYSRGCHLVTHQILNEVPQVREFSVGLMQVFIQHTSASLTLNENADPDVLTDMNMALNRLAPESWPYVHNCEGPDDMPAHVKSSLTDSSLTIPISDGRLQTGTWQGIYLCEHRNRGGRRRLVITIQGIRSSAVDGE
ncbi:MAG: secondary thiamine-phosphate synthase enzyme YjbQ [Planctomycetaceae bacterium]